MYCTPCYRKLHGIKGYGFGQGGPALLSADVTDGAESGGRPDSRAVDLAIIPAQGEEEGCPRCGGKYVTLLSYLFQLKGTTIIFLRVTIALTRQLSSIQLFILSCRVFHAEQMFSRTAVFHRSCFSCRSCRRPLDSVLACDGPDREIYCRGCYGKQFGARGYGFAGGRCERSPLSRCQPPRKCLLKTI